VPALFVLSLVLFTLFYFWSRHLEVKTSYPPIIKPSLFSRHRGRISATCACAFLSSLSIYGFVYSTTAFYQTYIGLSALGNAIKMLTCNVVGCLAAVSGSITCDGPGNAVMGALWECGRADRSGGSDGARASVQDSSFACSGSRRIRVSHLDNASALWATAGRALGLNNVAHQRSTDE
jgi:hypothetical protein